MTAAAGVIKRANQRLASLWGLDVGNDTREEWILSRSESEVGSLSDQRSSITRAVTNHRERDIRGLPQLSKDDDWLFGSSL